MTPRPATPAAYDLLHRGSIAFAEIEAHGMRIDVPYLVNTMNETAEEIDQHKERLKEDEVYKLWHRKFGSNMNIDSRDQLAVVLYDVMKLPVHSRTNTGRPQADELALERSGLPFATHYTEMTKLQKLLGTYLSGVLREVEGDRLHNNFNLHTVETYRSSSSNINFQNIPIRDPDIGKKIRQAFIPDDDCYIAEVDIVGAEVKVAACYHKDPTMLRYIKDGYDMHRDMAAECYRLPPSAVPKAVRQQAKALFVFAQFYGDYYVSCAASLWEAITRHKLMTADGYAATKQAAAMAAERGIPKEKLEARIKFLEEKYSLVHHLQEQGIERLGECNPKQRPQPGTFEKHLQEVEQRFWGERFPVYDRWRRDWHKAYVSKGWFQTLTGFVLKGVYSRNFVINAPVQGSAFHCLLWSLLKLHAWLKRNGLRTRIVGQIHDSIVLYIYKPELADVCAKIKQIMTEELPAAWPWIITPMEVEIEGSDKNWHEKKPFELAA